VTVCNVSLTSTSNATPVHLRCHSLSDY